MRAASDEFMSREEGATLGAALLAAPHLSIDTRAWYVGDHVPTADDYGISKPSMWDPGNRVSMIKVSFSREDAIVNATVDLAMNPSGDAHGAAPRLFEFTVRLDAVLDISTTDKLAAHGLTMPMIASFYNIESGLQRIPVGHTVLRDRLKMLAEAARAFRGIDENGTRIEKVAALASGVAFDGMLVLSPWHRGKDLLVFYDGWPDRVFIAHDTIEDLTEHGTVDLKTSRQP